jgi:hypothetical protein
MCRHGSTVASRVRRCGAGWKFAAPKCREETMKNEDQPMFIIGRRKPATIRTMIAATCAALAISMACAVVADACKICG